MNNSPTFSRNIKTEFEKCENNQLFFKVKTKVFCILKEKSFVLLTPTQEDILELEQFFQKNLKKYAEKFHWDDETLRRYLGYHSASELEQKIPSDKYFFSIIRKNLQNGKKGEIVAVFESKSSNESDAVEMISWTLVDEKFQNLGLGNVISYDFILNCREKWRKSILTFVDQENKSSLAVRKKFGFEHLYDAGWIYALEKKL